MFSITSINIVPCLVCVLHLLLCYLCDYLFCGLVCIVMKCRLNVTRRCSKVSLFNKSALFSAQRGIIISVNFHVNNIVRLFVVARFIVQLIEYILVYQFVFISFFCCYQYYDFLISSR